MKKKREVQANGFKIKKVDEAGNVIVPCGRPESYTQELADRICGELAQGISLRTVCKQPGYPHISTVFEWFRTKPSFAIQYEKAKEESADALAEEMMDIADNGSNDWMEKNDPDNPGYVYNGEQVQRSRLRVDTRKWIASKLKPKKYGERIDHTTDGKELPQPLLYVLNNPSNDKIIEIEQTN